MPGPPSSMRQGKSVYCPISLTCMISSTSCRTLPHSRGRVLLHAGMGMSREHQLRHLFDAVGDGHAVTQHAGMVPTPTG